MQPAQQKSQTPLSRRGFLAGSVAAAMGAAVGLSRAAGDPNAKKALISITLDLEMSRNYPTRDQMEWDYQKGNLDEPTKKYSVESGRLAKELGGKIHYFCVGRVLEQPNVEWLKEIAAEGHPVGNHTYDHVYVLASTADEIQFRFKRAPWLVEGRPVAQVIRENIAVTTAAMRKRIGIDANGFRTPGGFVGGLEGREDIQKMLLELGFTWCSSKYPAHNAGKPHETPTPDVYASIVEAQRHSQPFVYPSGLIEVPMSPISDVNAFRSNFWKLKDFLKAVRLGVEWAIDHQACYDFLAHPSCLGIEDPKLETIKLICDMVREAGDKAKIVGLDAIASRAQGV